MEILKTIGESIMGIGMVIASWFGYYEEPIVVQPPLANVGGDTNLFVGGVPYTLSGSGITSSATSIGLTSLTLPQNSYPLQDADFASTFYVTLEPGSLTRQEFASCTTVGANTGGTVTLSGCTRGLSPISPYTSSTTLRFTHAGGSKLIFSNSPAFYDQFTAKGNDETITGIYTFSASPIVPTPTTATQAVNKSYVDGGILAGAATSTESVTGISRLATKLQQASSTATTVNTPYVLQAQNATSTYNAGTAGGSGLNVVVTRNDNTIDSNFISTSSAYTWSGLNAFSATTTMATSTVASSTIVNLNITGTGGNAARTVDVQTFTSSGTWTKPSGAKIIEVYAVGAGGGGGSGRKAAAATSISGGSGGGGGSLGFKRFNASGLSATETVTIGAGGAGGAGVSGGDANGNNGSNGGNTTFGTTALIVGKGGSAGLAGIAGNPAGGAGGVIGNGDTQVIGGAGGAGTQGDASGSTGDDTASDISPRGGGAGGGFNAASAAKNGGVGGGFITNYVKAGGAIGTIGNSSITLFYGGTGGGGSSGAASSAVGGAGINGSGGGGSGAGSTASGAGGAGGDGFIIAITYF